MDSSTHAKDAVIADVRDKRLAIDRRIELLRRRMESLDPRRVPWQVWSVRALPVLAAGMTLYWWRRRQRRQYLGANWR